MANKKRAKTATDKEEIIEIMQATQEPFLKLAKLWHAATGRRPEEIFALRHCDIDTKRRKFRLRGNNWLAYDGQEDLVRHAEHDPRRARVHSACDNH